jgi:DNA-binding MltR family transcriptional regulator
MTKKKILPVENLSEDTQKFFDVLNAESDLAVILVAASYIDAALASILQRFLLPGSTTERLLNPRGGALGNFATRSDVCYTLGFICKPLYQDLIQIAEMRNICAHHHLSVDFSHEDIVRSCQKLSYVDSFQGPDAGKPIYPAEWLSGARNRFTLTAVTISQRLLVTALGTKQSSPSV